MALIEKEALIQSAEEVLTWPMLAIINAQPEIDATITLHSAWKTTEKTQPDGLLYYVHTCPICQGFHSDLRKNSIYRFCPHCGTKMDALKTT